MALEVRQESASVAESVFLRRIYHAAAVVDRFLYIDGGLFSQLENGSPKLQWASTTLSLDLRNDWTSDKATFHDINKSQAPTFILPALSYYKASNVLFSGILGRPKDDFTLTAAPPNNTALSLWALQLDGQGNGSWSNVIPAGDPAFNNLVRPKDSSVASSGEQAFFLNGGDTRGNPIGGMLQLDMASKSFRNTTSPFDQLWSGKMQFVPSYGQDGLLVNIGGASGTQDDGDIGWRSVQVYDVSNQVWYNQTTSGDFPEPRKEHCVEGLASSEQTYEIFVYGGSDGYYGADTKKYDTIHILSLPSFHWSQVSYPPEAPRNGHTCHAVGGSQILVVGGINPSLKETKEFTNMMQFRDDFPQGLSVFDMNALTWSNKYSASVPAYHQSKIIKDCYAPNGNCQTRTLFPAVAKLMDDKHFDGVRSASANTTDAITSSSSSSGTNKGAIAGGVVGSLVAIALLLVLIYLLYWRRKRSKADNEASSTEELAGNEKRRFAEVHGDDRPHEMDPLSVQELSAETDRPKAELPAYTASQLHGRDQ